MFGALEFLVVLGLVVGVPVGAVALFRRASGSSARNTLPAVEQQNRLLTAELESTRSRLEELEVRLARLEERAEFTESLLEKR